jgi:hypothetical protein
MDSKKEAAVLFTRIGASKKLFCSWKKISVLENIIAVIMRKIFTPKN